jgi:hypothetical protein
VRFGVGDGPGVGLGGAAPVSSGDAIGSGEAGELAIAEGATLPTEIVGGDAVADVGEVPPPIVNPKMIAAATPTAIASPYRSGPRPLAGRSSPPAIRSLLEARHGRWQG